MSESPLTTHNHINLLVFINRDYHETLEIPRATISQYARRPYKWLWFLGYIIFGRDGTGGYISDISSNAGDLHQPMSDDDMDRLELDDADAYIYYHSNISSTDHRLVDAQGADTRSITTSNRSMRDTTDYRIAEQRDQRQCVASSDLYYEHCHLIPHSKGDEYMEYVTRDSNLHISRIDHHRNILCLHTAFHVVLGRSRLAFLQTPNGRLQRDDLPGEPRHDPPQALTQDGQRSYLTIQYFFEPGHQSRIALNTCPHNSDIKQPVQAVHGDVNRLDERWPPQVIFNFVYALAAIQLWGTRIFRQYSKEVNHDLYTPKKQEEKAKKKQSQVEDRRKRHERRNQPTSGPGQAGTSHQGGAGYQVGMSKEDAEAALLGFWKYVDQWTARDPAPQAPSVDRIESIQKVTDWLRNGEKEQGNGGNVVA